MLNSESDFQVSNKNRNLLTVWPWVSSLADATVLTDPKTQLTADQTTWK